MPNGVAFSLAALAALLLATTSTAQTTLRAGDFVVQSWTANDRLARSIIAQAQQFDSLPGLPSDAPSFGRPIRIVLADNDARFREMTGGAAPEWGAGVASPAAGLIVLRAYGGTGGAYEELPRVLRHEIAHIALHRYLAEARIPRWFDEGYAVWAAGQLDMQAGWQLRVAFATERAPPLDSLELRWPALEVDAQIAYLLAASVIQYLTDESGERGLRLFLERWHDSNSFDTALAATYGLTLDRLELHWRRDVKRRYGWFAVLTQSGVFLLFASLGILALFWIRRRRDRAKLARLRETELPDEPAFWNEAESEAETGPSGIDAEEKGRDI